MVPLILVPLTPVPLTLDPPTLVPPTPVPLANFSGLREAKVFFFSLSAFRCNKDYADLQARSACTANVGRAKNLGVR